MRGVALTAVILRRLYFLTCVLLWASNEISKGKKKEKNSLVRSVLNITDFKFSHTWFYIPDLSPDSWLIGAKLLNFSELSFLVNKIKINSSLIGWS